MAGLARRWGGAVSFGLIEQFLLSGSSFVFTAAMAHHLGVEGFGWFAIAWACMTLLEAGGWGLFGDAVPASAQRLRHGRWPEFRRALIGSSGTYTLVAFALALVAAVVVWRLRPEQAPLVLATVFAFGCLRLQNTIRRIYYIDMKRRQAALAAVANVAMLTLCSTAIIVLKWHDPAAAMICYGCASLAAATCFLFQRADLPLAPPSQRLARWARTRLWRTGRWLMIAGGMSWLGNFGMVVILGALHGVELSGVLRTVTTLTTPPAQLTLVLMSLIVPRAAAALRRDPKLSRRRYAARAMALIVGLNGAYAVVLTALGAGFVHFLFGPPALGISTLTIAIATFGYALEGVRYGCNAVLMAEGRTVGVGVAQAVSLAVALALVPAVSRFGIDYVVAVMTFSNNINTLIVLIGFLKTERR